jgi:type I restriction enzyme S subunit
MTAKMKKYKLGELLDVTRGASLSGEYYSTEGEFLRLTLGNFDYQNGGFKENTSKDDLFFTGTVKPQFILNEGDIITPLTEQTQGLIGSTARIPQSGVYIQSQDVGLVKCNGELLDPDFCYYLLPSQIVKKQLSAGAQQTKIRHTSPDKIKDVTVFLPELSEQRKIGHILRSIDSQIDNLTAINRNLEQVARQLYDYWFVQFDFPNHDGKPYKSSGGEMVWNEKLKREIPTNWKSSSITAIADILSGGTPSKSVDEYWNGTIPFFGPTDVGYSIFQIDTKEHITQSGLEHCASSLFDEGTIIITARGSIGKLVVVGKQMAMNQSCYALHPKNGEFEYLFFLTIELIEHLKQKGSGSVFKSIIAIDIETSWLSIAPNSIIKDFCKVCSPIFKKIKENTIEIDRLQRLRDELLPMLLNGQVNCDLSN